MINRETFDTFHPLEAIPSCSHSESTNSSVTSSSPSSPPFNSVDSVSTIFVIGFPDDMQEREFQNMFFFSKGFEAASLKWHCKDQPEDQYLFSNMLNNKKQMIGFARFRTRQEASDAANEMNGKTVDVGCVLKAEMAKKNLYIKRNSMLPTPAVLLPELNCSPLTVLPRRLCQAQRQDVMPVFNSYESFSPLPSDLLSLKDYKNEDPFMNGLTTPNTPFNIRSQSIDVNRRNSNLNSPFQFKSFHPEMDIDDYLSKSTPVPHHDILSGFFNKNGQDLMMRKNTLQPPIIERSSSISRSAADHNPPCNTLYVGNLPPATNEEELRSLFAKCEGYKRMCFRNKPQGPMCFVEFEEVIYATQAMSQHQGRVLSNSTKGGIRLSFSKNPLFIKKPAFSFQANGDRLIG